MMSVFRSVLPYSDVLLSEIGRITVFFSELEDIVSYTIWETIPFDKELEPPRVQQFGQIVTAELSFKNKLAILNSLIFLEYGKDSTKAMQVEALTKRAISVEEKRNNITHSSWGFGKNEDMYLRNKLTAKQRDGLNFQSQEMDIEELRTISSEIEILVSDLIKYNVELKENPV